MGMETVICSIYHGEGWRGRLWDAVVPDTLWGAVVMGLTLWWAIWMMCRAGAAERESEQKRERRKREEERVRQAWDAKHDTDRP